MSGADARARLTRERKELRKTLPFGFFARPKKNQDGTMDLFTWECGIPGKEGTPWEGGLYKLRLTFDSNYPISSPKARFDPVIYHPNVFSDGNVCISILSTEKAWKPSITLREVLLALQDLLTKPNCNDPANYECSQLFKMSIKDYERRIIDQAKKLAAP